MTFATTQARRALARLGTAITALAVGVCALPASALAQANPNTTAGALGNNALCVGATNSGAGTIGNVTRTFNITGQASVADVNVGLIAGHSWRGDLRVSLTSPGPTATTVVLITEDTSNAGNVDNYNIVLDDQAAETVNSGTTGMAGPHVTTDTPYRWTAQPDNPLAAFNGLNGNGTWTLTICDDYGGENGNFVQAELIFPPAGAADLSLSLAASDGFPNTGAVTTISATLMNGGSLTASPTVQINLPAGVTYDSHSGPGTYDPLTGLWDLPNNIGITSQTLDIDVIPTNAQSYTVTAEVATSNRADPDSTPGNGVTTEDDMDSVSFVSQPPPTAPTLSCPVASQFTHNWTTSGPRSWTLGNTTQTYPAANASEEELIITLTGDLAERGESAGVRTPIVQTNVTGGLTTNQEGLHIAADYTDVDNQLVLDLDIDSIANGGDGVDQFQFRIFDVDTGGWIDRITVTADLDGTPVPVTLTRSGANYIDASDPFAPRAIGLNGAGNTTGNGNVTVTVTQPLDHLRFVYDNDPAIGPDPAFQIISLHDITTCLRTTADLSAEKTVEVYDPANLGLFMTPGNEVLYKITVTNSATATAAADDIDLQDTLPTNLQFVEATTVGFTGGAFANPALPPANQDCGVTPCVISFEGGSLPINGSGEIQVRALIK